MGKEKSDDLKSCMTSIVISRVPDYELRRLPMSELVSVVEVEREHLRKIECENEILQRYIKIMKIDMNLDPRTDNSQGPGGTANGAKKQKRVSKHILSATHKSKVYQAVIDEEKKISEEIIQQLQLNTENFEISQMQREEDLNDLNRKFVELDNLLEKSSVKNLSNGIRGEEMLTYVNRVTKRRARQLLKNLLQSKSLNNEFHELQNQLILKESENEYAPIDVERFSIEYQQLVRVYTEKNDLLQRIKRRSSRTVPLMTIRKDQLRNLKTEYEVKLRELHEKERILERLKSLCNHVENGKQSISKSSKLPDDMGEHPTKRDFMAAQIVQKIISANNRELDNKIYLNKIHYDKIRQNKKIFTRNQKAANKR